LRVFAPFLAGFVLLIADVEDSYLFMGLDFGGNDDLLFLFTGVHLTIVHIFFGGLLFLVFLFFSVFTLCFAMVV